MTGASQAHWMCLDRSECSVVLARQLHVVLMLDITVSSAPATEADGVASWRGTWLQARKAKGASMYALLIPIPHVNRQRRLFPLCIRELNVENSLKSVLQRNVELLQKRIVGAWRGPQDV